MAATQPVKIHELSATRNGSGENQQETIHLSSLARFANQFRWENLTMAGREVKGFVVPQWMAVVLIGAIFGGAGFMYKSVSGEMAWQHDQLVILATQKADADKAAKQEHDDRANQESADRAWREKMTNQMNELKYVVQNTKRSGGQN